MLIGTEAQNLAKKQKLIDQSWMKIQKTDRRVRRVVSEGAGVMFNIERCSNEPLFLLRSCSAM